MIEALAVIGIGALAIIICVLCALMSTRTKARRIAKQVPQPKPPETYPEMDDLAPDSNIEKLRQLLDVAERHGLAPVINAAYCISNYGQFSLDIQGEHDGAFANLVEKIVTPGLEHGWEIPDADTPSRKLATICIEEGGVKYYFRVSRW